jgi:hypothetical protein
MHSRQQRALGGQIPASIVSSSRTDNLNANLLQHHAAGPLHAIKKDKMRVLLLILSALFLYNCTTSQSQTERITNYYFPLTKIGKQTTYFYKVTISTKEGDFEDGFAIQIEPLADKKYSFVVLSSQKQLTDSSVLVISDSGIVIDEKFKRIDGAYVKEEIEGCNFVHSFVRQIGDSCNVIYTSETQDGIKTKAELKTVLKGYSTQDFSYQKEVEVSKIDINEIVSFYDLNGNLNKTETYTEIKNAKNIGLIEMVSSGEGVEVKSELIRIE